MDLSDHATSDNNDAEGYASQVWYVKPPITMGCMLLEDAVPTCVAELTDSKKPVLGKSV
jgi:hypothetical protein